MDLHEINQELAALPGQALKVFEQLHPAKSEYERLKKKESSLLAKLRLKHGDCKTRSEVDDRARDDDEYKEWEIEFIKANGEWNKHAARRDFIEHKKSVLQTICSNLRTEEQITQLTKQHA